MILQQVLYKKNEIMKWKQAEILAVFFVIVVFFCSSILLVQLNSW